MIKYSLKCDADHEFEGWFRDSADFDVQSGKGLLDCPCCGSDEIRKAVMAPAVARRDGDRRKRLASIQHDLARAAMRARDFVEKNFDYVGDKFPEEARKIHYGETSERAIYGEATGKDVKELIDEGVRIAPLPDVPSSVQNKDDKAGAPKTPSAAKKLN